MEWQTPLSTNISFLSGRHNIETLANIITDVDVLYFHNLSYEDFDDPSKSTRLRALHARSNSLVILAQACTTVNGDSVKYVHEVARVCTVVYGWTKQ